MVGLIRFKEIDTPTIYILFALYTWGEGPALIQQEFGSHGACEMAKSEGKRQRMFDQAFCTPKG